jgi:hypothetical protein
MLQVETALPMDKIEPALPMLRTLPKFGVRTATDIHA